VFQRANKTSAFKLIEVAPGVSVDDVRAKTTAHFEVAV
jgi:3-oxoacid CoA-transferase subunit B